MENTGDGFCIYGAIGSEMTIQIYDANPSFITDRIIGVNQDDLYLEFEAKRFRKQDLQRCLKRRSGT